MRHTGRMHAFDAGLLASVDSLALQQVSSLMSNDMQVLGPDGEVVAVVETVGGGLGRMLMGSRSFVVRDGGVDHG